MPQYSHDYIQWMFPTDERSQFAIDYELLTQRDIAELSASQTARADMAAAIDRFRWAVRAQNVGIKT